MVEPGDVLDRLHGEQVAAAGSSDSRLGDGGRGREHAHASFRARARHHVPLRPDVRLQRVLQVLQERRERALQVHSDGPPRVLRRHRHARDGHRHHHRRRVRGDAEAVRRRMASRQLSDVAQSMDRFIDKVKQETHGEIVGDLEIIRIPLEPLPRSQRDQPSMGHRGGERPPVRAPRRRSWSAIRRSALLTSSRSRWASSARCSSRDSSRNATCPRGHARSLRALHLQAVASGLHAEQDDQEQQGSVPVLDDPIGLLDKLHIY